MVSHCVHLVEHPELVAQRIERFAGVVGRERVIAGTDCGFGTSGAGDEVHPDVAWAKLARWSKARGSRAAGSGPDKASRKSGSRSYCGVTPIEASASPNFLVSLGM